MSISSTAIDQKSEKNGETQWDIRGKGGELADWPCLDEQE